uniref:Uncharacterized protein n=1 Tax=viral metagenome TaxID=1070528 RepID=A0A6C0H3Z5_9ZZZZ
MIDNYILVDDEPYKTIIYENIQEVSNIATKLRNMLNKVYDYNRRLFFKKSAKELDEWYNKIEIQINLLKKRIDNLYELVVVFIKGNATWKTLEPITLSKIQLNILKAFLEYKDYEDKLESYVNTVHTYRDRVANIARELEELLETIPELFEDVPLSLRLNQEELDKLNSNVEVKLDEIRVITDNLIEEAREAREDTHEGPDDVSAGGKKSKKRRTQSKQTKRRQRKINKKSKIKYTIRRR